MKREHAIGIDIGGRNIKTVVVRSDGSDIRQKEVPTEETADAFVATVNRAIEDLVDTLDAPIAHIGLSAPGLAARDGRSIAWMQGRLDAVQGLDWTEALGREQRVWVLNDAHAATLGESWLGAAAGKRNVVLLTLGTGVGGGIVVDGNLLTGHLGRAGHVGHISLDVHGQPDIIRVPGSLEDAVGDCTIRKRSDDRFDSTAALLKAVEAEDQYATKVWLDSVHALACGIVSLINVADPEIVVIGGGISAAGERLFTPLREAIAPMEWRPTGERVDIVPATLGPFAGAVGCARFAITSDPNPSADTGMISNPER